jgi:hypothetical protein
MASLKFRVDIEEENEYGQFIGSARWMGGPTVARIRNCRCKDGSIRTAYVTGEPDTFFSLPARVNVGKRSVKGFLTVADGLWQFTPEQGA